MLKVATLDSLAEPTLNITVLGLYSSISRGTSNKIQAVSQPSLPRRHCLGPFQGSGSLAWGYRILWEYLSQIHDRQVHAKRIRWNFKVVHGPNQ